MQWWPHQIHQCPGCDLLSRSSMERQNWFAQSVFGFFEGFDDVDLFKSPEHLKQLLQDIVNIMDDDPCNCDEYLNIKYYHQLHILDGDKWKRKYFGSEDSDGKFWWTSWWWWRCDFCFAGAQITYQQQPLCFLSQLQTLKYCFMSHKLLLIVIIHYMYIYLFMNSTSIFYFLNI